MCSTRVGLSSSSPFLKPANELKEKAIYTVFLKNRPSYFTGPFLLFHLSARKSHRACSLPHVFLAWLSVEWWGSPRGATLPPSRYLAMPGDILRCQNEGGFCWHLTGRGQRCCPAPCDPEAGRWQAEATPPQMSAVPGLQNAGLGSSLPYLSVVFAPLLESQAPEIRGITCPWLLGTAFCRS